MEGTSKRISAVHTALLGAAASIALASPARAQDTDAGAAAQDNSGGLQEIIVTAQKRAENLQDVPLSVSAVTGETLERLHQQDLSQITATVPNVQVQVNGGLSLSASYVIRGIGIAANPSPYVGTEVGTVVDGVVASSNALGLSDQFDMERVEVLRGPQGTLFGANTTGGVINFITRQPTGELGAYGQLTIGNYNRIDAQAAVNVPLSETLAAKIAVSHRSRDGYYTNLYTGDRIGGLNSTTVRGYLRWEPSSDFDATLITELRRMRNGTDVLLNIAYPGEIFYRPDTPYDFKLYSDVPDQHDTDTISNTLTINVATGIGKLTSVTNYSHYNTFGYQDIDGIDLYGYAQVGRDKGWQFSQELRNQIEVSDNFQWLVGAYAQLWGYNSVGHGWTAFVDERNISVNLARQRTTNLAAFTQIYWDITDRLRLQGGARVSHEKVRLSEDASTWIQPNGTDPALGFGNLVGAIKNPYPADNMPTSGRESWTNFGGKIGLDYRATDDVMLYGFYARGFKSGGFNGRVTSAADIGPYDPEFVDSFELGLKSDLLDKHLRLNLSLFLNKWDNMQVNQVLYRGTPPQASSTILNAAKATTKGVEIEAEIVPSRFFRISGTLGYLDAKYDDFTVQTSPTTVIDYGGRALVYSPKWNGSVTATGSFDVGGGKLETSAQYVYNGARWGNYTQAPSERLRAYNIVNANINWSPESEKWSIGLWARNLFDERYLSLALDAPPLFTEGLFGNPREFGVDLRFNF
jgi:iron complex outermembrane receptor protein